MVWRDITTFSRGEVVRIPRTWETKAGNFRIVVTRRIHQEGWYLSVNGLADNQPLGDVDSHEAKALAVKGVREKLEIAIRELGGI